MAMLHRYAAMLYEQGVLDTKVHVEGDMMFLHGKD